MPIAQIGPFTEILESVAAAVGAGALVGTFMIGTAGFLRGRSRRELAERAVTDGYIGGLGGMGLVLLDLILRYLL